MKRRILNILIAIDQLVWVLLTFGNGRPDETISAAAWRMEGQGKVMGFILRPLIDTLFWFDPEHCRKSYNAEFYSLHLPTTYQNQRGKNEL
jgi:hypothetical protein